MASYKFLSDKPKINSNEIVGSKALEEYSVSPIKFDLDTRYLYTILQDGTRVNIKKVPRVPSGYTDIEKLVFTSSTPAVYFPITGDVEWEATLAWPTNNTEQEIGFELAANAYIGITSNHEISAEWSMPERAIIGSDPTAKNTIHTKFVSLNMTELTIDGFDQVSYGYPDYMQSYSKYTYFYLNATYNSSIIQMTYWWCRFTQNGNIVYDLYPCKRDSDDALGFYDIIGDTFYPVTGAAES